MDSAIANNSLPREVLKWIQSLDLAYSVKNVRRDFANGFLVAEIVSRYYKRDISMHSYDNGDAAKKKRDNWAQLLKVFRRLGLADLITEEDANLCASLESGTAVKFLCNLYEAFTGKKLQTATKKPMQGRVPGYTRDTAANKVKKAFVVNDLDEHSDVDEIRNVGSLVVSEHERDIQSLRNQEPERFNPSTASQIATRAEEGAPKPYFDENESGVPQVKVKEISVKQLDRNVTHLRASKAMQGTASVSSPTQGMDGSKMMGFPSTANDSNVGDNGLPNSNSSIMSGHAGMNSANNANMGGMGNGASLNQQHPENVLSLLGTCISRVYDSKNIPEWLNGLDPYQAFLMALNSPWRGDEQHDALVSNTLREICMSVKPLAEACGSSMQQYWKVSDLVCSAIINCPASSKSYSVSIDIFCGLGRNLITFESEMPLNIFVDFSLSKLTDTLAKDSSKRLGILAILDAFTSNTTVSRVTSIKRLQSVVPDMATFINCLMILAQTQEESKGYADNSGIRGNGSSNGNDEMLLDLYAYYANIGLSDGSPRVRTSAIALLSLLVPKAVHLLLPLLDAITTLARTESWWELQTQLLILCGALLKAKIGEKEDPNMEISKEEVAVHQMVLDVIELVFRADAPTSVKLMGLSSLPAVTHMTDPLKNTILSKKYIDVFTSLSDSDQRSLLGQYSLEVTESITNGLTSPQKLPKISIDILLPSATGISYSVGPLVQQWNGYSIISNIVQILSEEGVLSEIPSNYMTTIHATLTSTTSKDTTSNNVFQGNNNSAESGVLDGLWVDIWGIIKGAVFTALNHVDRVDSSLGIINSYIISCPQLTMNIMNDDSFVTAMKSMYGASANAVTQKAFESFLRELYSQGGTHSQIAADFLTDFAKNASSLFEKSVTLQKLLKELR